MKKFISLSIIFILLFGCFVFGCEQKEILTEYVSELRRNLYEGKSENYTVKAAYGFREEPFVNDGKVGNLIDKLTFKLLSKETDNATYTLTFNYNEQEFNQKFVFNPVTNSLICSLEIENFNLQSFDIKILSSSNGETVTMTSIVPENTIDYETALKFLRQNQPDLVGHYTDADGNLTAELYIRILVKNDKPYWYVGIASGNNNLKALLIDGANGQVLAIRDIF